MRLKVLERVEGALARSPALRYAAFGLAVLGLTLILYPALWNSALGGLLERAVPTPIYNAIHELRHLWGIPCH